MSSTGRVRALRVARRGFLANAFFWGVGNGLIGSALIAYIVRTLAEGALDAVAIGLAVSWCIAAPRLVGCLRILTPSVIDWVGSRKRVCFFSYLVSPLLLALLPILLPVFSTLGKSHIDSALVAVGVIWAGYHLVEYFGTVALWSWMGDCLSNRTRARFLARRERWMLLGQLPAMLAGGLWTWMLHETCHTPREKLDVYLGPAVIGIIFLILAAVPLLKIPEFASGRVKLSLRHRFRQLIAPLVDRRFCRLILFGCWLQFAGGLVQGPQSLFQMNVLGITLLGALTLNSTTRLGQILAAGPVGRALDRFGSLSVMATALLLVACGSLFYAVAGAGTWFLIIPSALLWISWVGVNLGVQNLTLAWAPLARRSSYLALYMTATTLVFGLATMMGGWLYDQYRECVWSCPVLGIALDYYTLCFIGVSLLRFFAIILLLRLFWTGGSSVRSTS
ncbi:MAG: hypothetical protein Q4G68_07670 [Planctomycetia bacterium]|nr:hypothetical protein [Planctomycetia bacterium]